MRWWPFILLAGLVLTLQSAIAPRLALYGVRADWVLILVVFFALHGRRTNAVIAAWSIGFCADLMSIERVGLLALSYAIAAWFVGSFRDYLFRRRALTQFVVTFAAAFLLQMAWLVYRRVVFAHGPNLSVEWALSLIAAPLYTALWAPPVHRALLGIAPWLGLPSSRYSFAGLNRVGSVDV